jgi:hypothetical protein
LPNSGFLFLSALITTLVSFARTRSSPASLAFVTSRLFGRSNPVIREATEPTRPTAAAMSTEASARKKLDDWKRDYPNVRFTELKPIVGVGVAVGS